MTTSKILFDDVIMTPLHLSAIHYNQKIGDATIITFSKFHQVGIKTKKVMEGNGIPPPKKGLRDLDKAWNGYG